MYQLSLNCIGTPGNFVTCLYRDIHNGTFTGLIDVVSDHLENDGELLSQEDVLKVVRPICTNVEVRTDLKMELLQILEKSFELDSADIFLLVFYQTGAILATTWGRNVCIVIAYSYIYCSLFSILMPDTSLYCNF